jgi:integrating conjugative element protein (TIGR03757 family)
VTGAIVVKRSPLVIAALVLCLGPAAVRAQEVVEVFRLSDQSVTGSPAATVYVIDAMHHFTERLSVGLPKTAAEARPVARARLEALTPQDKEALHRASTGLIRAAEYQIVKAPAIVFDRKAVVYGISDVEQARAIYRGWRARGGAS